MQMHWNADALECRCTGMQMHWIKTLVIIFMLLHVLVDWEQNNAFQ